VGADLAPKLLGLGKKDYQNIDKLIQQQKQTIKLLGGCDCKKAKRVRKKNK
jgi:hypothetical protein